MTMIIDQWEPSKKRYRYETSCYGPKSRFLYKPGPTRKVPGRKGMTWQEEDWVDEDATSHRGGGGYTRPLMPTVAGNYSNRFTPANSTISGSDEDALALPSQNNPNNGHFRWPS